MANAWSPEELDQVRQQLETGAKQTKAEADAPRDERLEQALDAAVAEVSGAGMALVAAPAEAAPAAAPAPVVVPELVALERLFVALAGAASSQVAKLLARVSEVFGAIEQPALRAAIQDKVLAFFDATARRIQAEQPAALEAFVLSVAEALRGTGILESHPLGAVVADVLAARRKGQAVQREVAAIAAEESDPKSLADKIVKKIAGRLDGATKIVATRMLGAEVDAKSSAFCARFESRVLGANLSVLDRFESAVSLPEKFFDFDERFKIAASVFPGGIAGTDGADQLGGLGKFAWLLGADVATHEGYEGVLSTEDAMAFADAQARSVDDEIVMGDGGALGDLGGLGQSVALSSMGLGAFEGMSRFTAAPKLSGASLPAAALAGGASRAVALPRVGAAPSLPSISSLPPAAVSAIKSGDVQALNLSLGGNASMPKLESLMSLRSLPALRLDGGVGALSHVTMGFQSAASAQASSSALRAIERLSFGGMGMSGGPTSYSFVSSPSTSYATLPIAKLTTSGIPTPHVSTQAARTLETRLLPAAKGGAGIGSYAGVPSVALAGVAAPQLSQLRAATSVARRAAVAGVEQKSSTVPAYAISSDSFGVPRYRGSQALPLAATVRLAGLDLSGTVVSGRSLGASDTTIDVRTGGRVPAPYGPITEVSPGVRVSGLENVAHLLPSMPSFPMISSGAKFGYTRDGYGITRIQSLKGGEGTALLPRSADLGGLDLAKAGVTLSPADLAGGMAEMGRNLPWMERLQQGGGMTASSGLGARTLRASLREHAGAGQLAFGPVELAFPSSSVQAAPVAPQGDEGGVGALLPTMPVSPAVGRRVRAAAMRRAGVASAPRVLRRRGQFTPAMPAALPAHQAAESGYVAAASIRLGAAPSREVLGSLPTELAMAPSAGMPTSVEKYYASATSPRLALGSIAGFQLASFGGGAAPSVAAAATALASGGDFAPLALQRLTGVTMGAAPAMPGMRFDLPAGASFDAAGFAPAGRMGGVAAAAADRAGMADDRYGRVGRDVQALRANYSGAKLWSNGLSVAAPEMLELKLAAAAEAGALGMLQPSAILGASADLSGAVPFGFNFAGAMPTLGATVPTAIALPQGGTGVVEMPASQVAGAPAKGGSLGWRAVRPTAPRVQGVYGAPAAAPSASDVLGLSAMGGFDAAHMPSVVSPRMATLGLDADLAPTIDRLTARGEALDPLTAKALRPILGDAVEQVMLASGPEAAAAAQALGTPAFAAGQTVVLGEGVDLGTRRGMSVLAHEGRHALSGRAPIHRFVDKVELPGEADARAAGDAAAHVLPPAGDGQVFGLVPKQVRGRFSDRFALDGWTEGDIRYSSGQVDAGMKLREANRGLDLAVDHEFVRFAGDITKLPAAALPIDLTSQLTGRGEIVARSQQGPEALGFAARAVEMPLKAVFWGRKGGDRVARGGMEVREVTLPSRFTTVDPTRIEGALALEAAEGVLPASYRLEQGVRPAGAAPVAGGKAPAAPAALRQQPGAVKLDAGDIKIRGRFAETSTTVRASGEFAADLTASKSFVESIAPSAETLPKNADFLAATGLDPVAAQKLVDGNRGAAANLRAGYVRRGGLPSASEWALSVNVGAPEAAPSEQGSMALAFKRAAGASEELVAPTSPLGRKVRSEAGKPLSSPVLDFMERFFKRDLAGVRVNEGATAKELNQELDSEAFTAGNEIYVGTPKGTSDEQLATLGHEIAHVIGGPAAPARPAQRPSQAPQQPRRGTTTTNAQERRSRDAERAILTALRNEPKERRAPKLPMTHTKVSSAQAEAEDAKAPIQKKKAADTSLQMFEKSGQVLPKPWEALFPRPPKRDLTPLVYQIWNKIKKDLSIEMERRSGGF